ncbi:MAG TPA: RidA family protein [Longimicrobiales bacterium]|nr:RidA family protein [Longimicrobiales bacterium]
MSDVVHPDGWPRGQGYAHGIVAQGNVLTVAGQIGCDPRTLRVVSDDFAEQVEQALHNIVAIVRKAGGQVEDVVRLTWYITDRQAYLQQAKQIGTAYRRHFGAHYPAMSVVVVAGLLEARAQVEIEATAVLRAGTS